MHNTTERRKRLSRDGFTIAIAAFQPGNLFPINVQIAQAAMTDKRGKRRKVKQARKQRQWKGE
jgi:hypothetical protein